MGGATNSGYAIDTTKVGAVTSDLKYLFFGYKPAINCLEDICNLVTAANAGAAGPHWIVLPDGKLCVGTVGAHENPPSDVWATWFNTDQAGSTIEVGKDMIVTQFRQKEADANYVLYAGALRKPGSGDHWTENQTALWGVDAYTALSHDTGFYKVGAGSLKATIDANNPGSFYYPSAANAAWDITKWGGDYNIPFINFFAAHSDVDEELNLNLFTDWTTGRFAFDISTDMPVANKWYSFSLPIGPNYKTIVDSPYVSNSFNEWAEYGTPGPDWANINFVQFGPDQSDPAEKYIWIDGLHFTGFCFRAAYYSGEISSDKASLNLIVDNFGKDDSGKESDVSGVIARLAYAELLRSHSTPITGEIVIPANLSILAGQKAHIHAEKKSDDTFRINKDFRIYQHHLHFEKPPVCFRSYLTLTDDLTNSYARSPNEQYTNLMKAVAPNFQTRESGSIKTRDIDLTQEIFENDYT